MKLHNIFHYQCGIGVMGRAVGNPPDVSHGLIFRECGTCTSQGGTHERFLATVFGLEVAPPPIPESAGGAHAAAELTDQRT